MSASKRIIAAVAALVLVAAGASGWWWWRGRGAIDPTDTRQVAQGEHLYRRHCAECHGAKLEGLPDWQVRKPSGVLPAPPHDASGHTWHHPDDVLFGITKHGIARFAPPDYKSDMPGFVGTLSDAEIRAVLAYIKSTWPEDIRQRQDGMNKR